MRDPFPLQWPPGWARVASGERKRAPFYTKLGAAVADLLEELRKLGAVNHVITSDLPTGRAGRPYSTGRAEDPGIAVWFVMDGQERVIACDRWDDHAGNVRAISLTIAAIRGMARWGASDIVSRAFAGFNALPAGAPVITPRSWRDVFEVDKWIAPPTSPEETLDRVRKSHRAMMKASHPDVGGSHERAVELNAALEAAERELSE